MASGPFLKAVLAFDYKSSGWQETYFLKSTDRSAALGVARQLAYYRSAFFGLGVTITYVRVSSSDSLRDGLICQIPYPLGPSKTWVVGGGAGPDDLNPPDNRNAAVMMRFETATGQWLNRYFTCCPDQYTTDDTLQFPSYFQAPDPIGVFPDPVAAGPPNHLQVCQYFWAFLLQNMPLVHRDPITDALSSADLANVVFKKISSRKRGRPTDLSAGRRQKNLIS